ncbi:MAG: signal peptidase I [Oscillospiraceae bacterium]|nr:signal peptidase I [Oscillospiraceae bacterium]
MKKIFVSVLKTISSVLLVILLVLAFLLAGMRFIGFDIYTVLSGSMEPEFMTGSVIYVKEVDPNELSVNDIITFEISGGTVATHRIIELVPDEQNPEIIRFRTKGDNNDMEDGSLVEKSQVIGSPVFDIPYLGYLAAYIQNPAGRYFAFALGAFLLLLMLLPDLLTEGKGKKKKSADEKNGGETEN